MQIQLPKRPTVAVHKFASCDGCQLAFLNAGEALLALCELVEFVHFAEAGPVSPMAPVDIAFIEGSVSTPEDLHRIRGIRERSKYIITIGACATAGGIQALRNGEPLGEWIRSIYSHPEYISSLETSTPIAAHVHVDFEIWGCPVSPKQVFSVLDQMLRGIAPTLSSDPVCGECKRKNHVCVAVAKGESCLGPVTRTGCGALCPSVGRGCYGCFGPSDQVNAKAIASTLGSLGVEKREITHKLRFINNQAEGHKNAALWSEKT